MKNRFPVFAILCVAMIAFAACEKPVSQFALYIPKDASLVFTVDTKAVMDKIASSGMTIDSVVNMLTEQNDEQALRWTDIKNSGVDLNQPVSFFSKETNSIQSGNMKSNGLIAQVEDAKKLEAFLKKERPDNDILSGGKYKYISLGDGAIGGWTDKIFIISSVTGGNVSPGTYSTGEGTLSQLQLTTLFTQDKSASIASVDEFNDMLSKKGDIRFYTNSSVNLAQAGMLGMTKAKELLQGGYTEGTINFEKGKMVAAAETHNNKTLADMLGKYPSKEINKDMLTNYPNPVNAFGIIAFNPKVLADILQYLGFDMMANGYTSQMGFSINDIFNAFSGDIAIIVSPGKENSSETETPDYKLSAKYYSAFLLNMGIGDKVAFNKVMSGLLNKQVLTKSGDQYQLGTHGGHGFVIEATGDNFYISSGDALIKAYEAGNNKSSLPADVDKEISNKSMAVYIDIAALLNTKAKDSSLDIHLHDRSLAFNNTRAAAKETFKNFIASTDKGDGKTMKANLELNFVNAGENSLASFVKFMAIAHKENPDHKHGWTSYPPLSRLPGADRLPAVKDSSAN